MSPRWDGFMPTRLHAHESHQRSQGVPSRTIMQTELRIVEYSFMSFEEPRMHACHHCHDYPGLLSIIGHEVTSCKSLSHVTAKLVNFTMCYHCSARQ